MANVGEDLARLAQLRNDGVLTQQEFEQQKAAVLAGVHPATPEAANEAPGKKKMGKGCLIAIAVIVVLLVIAAIAGGGNKGATVDGPTIGNDAAPAAAAENDDAAPGVTMEGYNRVKSGMTFEQVTAIIGEPSQELTRNEMAGTETVMYQWDASLGASMNAMFQNGKLVQKAQFGLR